MPTGVGLREFDTMGRQRIHVWRADLPGMMRIQTDVRVTLVVGQDDDNVGLLCNCCTDNTRDNKDADTQE